MHLFQISYRHLITFIFSGIDAFSFIRFGKVSSCRETLSCKRCFSLKMMYFYLVFLFLQDKVLKYIIFMISFIENALKFYYKYLIKTKLKKLMGMLTQSDSNICRGSSLMHYIREEEKPWCPFNGALIK